MMRRPIQAWRSLFLAGYTFLLSRRVVSAATGFSLHSDPTCDNGLSITNVELACSDEGGSSSSTCEWGHSAFATGTLSIPETGLNGRSISSKACVYGWSYLCREFSTDSDFCDIFSLQPYDCPQSGEYSVGREFDIPEDPGFSLGSFWWFLVTATLTNDDGTSYTCQFRIDTTSNSSSSNTAYFFCMSGLFIGGVATIVLVRKRRLRARINLAGEESLVDQYELAPSGGGVSV